MEIRMKIIEGGVMPKYTTMGASGADCYARIASPLGISIPAHSRCLINLGFALELPEGYEAQIRPRSSLSFKGIDCALGTIDSDYRGEVKACIINNTEHDYEIYDKNRICQMVIESVHRVKFDLVDELTFTERNEQGFGSTGV